MPGLKRKEENDKLFDKRRDDFSKGKMTVETLIYAVYCEGKVFGLSKAGKETKRMEGDRVVRGDGGGDRSR